MSEIDKYRQCLDKIEEIAKNGVKDDCGMPLDELSIILQLIKQAKEEHSDADSPITDAEQWFQELNLYDE